MRREKNCPHEITGDQRLPLQGSNLPQSCTENTAQHGRNRPGGSDDSPCSTASAATGWCHSTRDKHDTATRKVEWQHPVAALAVLTCSRTLPNRPVVTKNDLKELRQKNKILKTSYAERRRRDRLLK